MTTTLELGGIAVDVVKKDIKNVHLSVYPPVGRVRISAPLRMNTDTIRVFAISKLRWIKRQQTKLRQQEREAPRECLNRESHYLWGKRYLLKVIERDEPSQISLKPNQIVMQVRPGSSIAAKQALLDEWYRQCLREIVSQLISKWEPLMGVKVDRLFVRRMKTRWGSCNHRSKSIRLNTELAKKPRECLEYIVVHEMAHLIESTHNSRFVALMDHYMPKWQAYRDALNSLPVRHEDWGY